MANDSDPPPANVDLLTQPIWETEDVPLMEEFVRAAPPNMAGFADPRLFPAMAAIELWQQSVIPADTLLPEFVRLGNAAKRSRRSGFPCCFVANPLFLACLDSCLLPGKSTLAELKWSKPAMCFYLPVGSLIAPDTKEVLYCGYALPSENSAEPAIFYARTRSGVPYSIEMPLLSQVSALGRYSYWPEMGFYADEPPDAGISTCRGATPPGVCFASGIAYTVIRLATILAGHPEFLVHDSLGDGFEAGAGRRLRFLSYSTVEGIAWTAGNR